MRGCLVQLCLPGGQQCSLVCALLRFLARSTFLSLPDWLSFSSPRSPFVSVFVDAWLLFRVFVFAHGVRHVPPSNPTYDDNHKPPPILMLPFQPTLNLSLSWHDMLRALRVRVTRGGIAVFGVGKGDGKGQGNEAA